MVISDSSLYLQLVCSGSKWHLSSYLKKKKAKMGKRMERKEKELRGREEIHTLTQMEGGMGEEEDTQSGRGGILCMF